MECTHALSPNNLTMYVYITSKTIMVSCVCFDAAILHQFKLEVIVLISTNLTAGSVSSI